LRSFMSAPSHSRQDGVVWQLIAALFCSYISFGDIYCAAQKTDRQADTMCTVYWTHKANQLTRIGLCQRFESKILVLHWVSTLFSGIISSRTCVKANLTSSRDGVHCPPPHRFALVFWFPLESTVSSRQIFRRLESCRLRGVQFLLHTC
jgi:hypothetical protein